MIGQCTVPKWNLKHQRQAQVEGAESNRSTHVHTHQLQNPTTNLGVPMYALKLLLAFFSFLSLIILFQLPFFAFDLRFLCRQNPSL